jgi:hypothetical protein
MRLTARLPRLDAFGFSRVMVTLMLIGVGAPLPAYASQKCDPLSDADVGWSVVPSHETIKEVDGAPYQSGAPGNWVVDRTTTELPFCNYFNEIGIYSMRSYRLDPETTTERVNICRPDGQGGSAAVPPYTGSCPPK